MTYLAAAERAALCDLALEVGPTAPTLCGGWAVRELLAHLVLRESSPAAVGLVVPALSGLTERATARLARRDFEELVRRVRSGPPVYSPLRLRPVDRALNAMEYFVHHEDIRRAQPGWEPRLLSPRAQDALWRLVRTGGRGLVRGSQVGVLVARSDTGDEATLKAAEPPVTVRGLPAEVALFVYGRKQHAAVDLVGPDEAVAMLSESPLGI